MNDIEEGLQKLLKACQTLDPRLLLEVDKCLDVNGIHDFLKLLRNKFTIAKERGISKMDLSDAVCSHCYKGHKVHHFTADHDPFFSFSVLALREKGNVREVMFCSSEDPDNKVPF